MDFSIEILPTEILLKIFDYLSLGDLFSCGLTCHSWKIILQDTKFLKGIQLTLDTVDITSSNPRINSLLKSERKYYHLSLNSIDLNSAEDAFWVKFGHEITSLTLRQCELSFNKIATILKYLPNLEHLTFDNLELFENVFDLSLNISDLECLSGFLNNIKTFNITYELVLIDGLFSKLMDLMPNIENLTVDGSESTPSEDNYIFWNCLYQYITRQATKLKSLKINGLTLVKEAFHDLLKVEKLNLNSLAISSYEELDDEIFCNFLRSQKELKNLTIKSQYLLDSHVLAISNSLKDLERLDFSCYLITEIAISNLYKLKNLKTLNIWCLPIAIIDGMKTNLVKFKNDKLKELDFNLYYEGNENINTFVSDVCHLYTNLTRLSLGLNDISDNIVQTIFENIRWLRTLQLRRCTQVTDFGLIGAPEAAGTTSYSISRLKGLRILVLSDIKLSEKSYKEIAKCKELKVLNVYYCVPTKLDPINLNEILCKYGSLEKLYIGNCADLTLEDVKIITHNIPRLKDFSID